MRSAALLLLAACTPEVSFEHAVVDPSPDGSVEAIDQEGGDVYEAASAAWDVPSDLLRAIALAETGMQWVVGEEGHDDRPAAYGIMALRGERVLLAAELAGLDPARVRTRLDANVDAAAALLSSWAEEAGIDRSELAAWAPLVARYGGMEDEEAQRQYVWRGVYKTLKYGFELEGRRIKAYGVDPLFPAPAPDRAWSGPNYGPSVWRPSPNYNSRSAGAGGIGMVVIHSCEGAYSGCWSWLVNAASGVSAHYVINEAGTEVSQLVDEANRAWHVGANYDCALNGNTECSRNGWNVNHFSIGIEHAGYASQTSWNNTVLDTSAQLVCDITRDHGIARDSYHIVSHGRLQPYNRTDPGAGWPWTDYINRVNAFCGANPPPPPPDPNPAGSVVIDSNNAYNDTASYNVEVSANWVSSQNVAGYYNTGYWAGPVAAVSDPARFKFYSATDVCYAVDGWWTAAGDRSTAAPFIAYNAANTEMGRTSVNQQGGHGQWNRLGTWAFSPGWNQVALSRWTSGSYVIADAIRLVPSDACVGCQFDDTDNDGTNDCGDQCPTDAGKTAPGVCGCGVAETDSDADGARDCQETCDTDPAKTAPGVCGCGASDADADGDGFAACLDACPADAGKTAPGVCGCGSSDADLDGDGAPACLDACPVDAGKTAPGVCGCSMPDLDLTGDGVVDCVRCGDGALAAPEQCDDGNTVGGDGCSATCQLEALVVAVPTPGVAGVVNRFSAQGAVAGRNVLFYASGRLGATPVPGCPGVSMPIAAPAVLGQDLADAAGVAEISLRVPTSLAGRQGVIVAVEQASCRVSGVRAEVF